MIELVDYSACPLNGRYFGGDAGRKFGVSVNEENWIIKFPKHTASGNRAASYTNSPLGEYIGSHVYAAFGIPVHKTALGVRDGCIVVGCKDFQKRIGDLVEFKSIKNSYLPSEGREGSSGSGNGTVLSDLLDVIENVPVLSKLDGVQERFWDMLVMDFFIGNSDRNNTNWGIVSNDSDGMLLAPVYDNGRAFTESIMLDYLSADSLLKPEVLKGYQCNFLDDEGRFIKPYELFSSHAYRQCDDALLRFADRYDADAVRKIIAAIPSQALGYDVITEVHRELFINLTDARYRQVIEPCLKAI
jgi:hypothetical protein